MDITGRNSFTLASKVVFHCTDVNENHVCLTAFCRGLLYQNAPQSVKKCVKDRNSFTLLSEK
jgi:hypothetical protein